MEEDSCFVCVVRLGEGLLNHDMFLSYLNCNFFSVQFGKLQTFLTTMVLLSFMNTPIWSQYGIDMTSQ